MVLTACKRGDEIILPRNVHRSVINALVLCGAVPVYVNPEVDHRLGISLGMKREQVARAIAEHPKAVAVLVNNPTYYGICSTSRPLWKWRTRRVCCASWTKRTARTSILAKICLSRPWRPARIWRRCLCTRAAAA
jgi:arginine/lysine/ornithine decarboxylase